MYNFPAGIRRATVTVSHGANVAATSTASVSASVAGAQVGDRAIVTPVAAPAAGILVGAGRQVTTAGQVIIDIANVTTVTVAAGTAVQYNVSLLSGG